MHILLLNVKRISTFALPKMEIMSKKKEVIFDVLIEIPKGSRNKYEYDFVLNKIRLFLKP